MQQKNRLRGSLGTLVLIISALPGARAIAQQVPITAFSPTANVQTFTPGFTGVGNLIPGPISLPPITLTSHGTVPTGSGSQPFETYFGIQNNSNQSGWFANIPGASQGNVVIDNASESDIDIDFSTPQLRVGLLLASPVNDSWTINAYDGGLNLLGSFTVNDTAGHAVFAGFQSSGIHLSRLEVKQSVDNGLVTSFDDIRYEVPEPSSTSLYLIAIAVIALNRFRRDTGTPVHAMTGSWQPGVVGRPNETNA